VIRGAFGLYFAAYFLVGAEQQRGFYMVEGWEWSYLVNSSVALTTIAGGKLL
jgi:hypothetical protein